MKLIKSLLPIVLIPFMFQCATITSIPLKGSFFYGYDFSKYCSNGFLITPHEYQGKYLTTGIFTQELIPEIRWDKSLKFNKKDAESFIPPEGFEKEILPSGISATQTDTYQFCYIVLIEKISSDKAISDAVEFVKRSGGNGIMDFQITNEVRTAMIKNKPISYFVFKINGTGIKIE